MVGAQGFCVRATITLLAGLCCLDQALAGPAIAPGTSAPGMPGDPGSYSPTDLGLRFSDDVVFNPVFTSPVQQIFSTPASVTGSGAQAGTAEDPWSSDTQLLSTMVASSAAYPLIAPMAPVLATLAAPAQLAHSYSAKNQQAARAFYCLRRRSRTQVNIATGASPYRKSQKRQVSKLSRPHPRWIVKRPTIRPTPMTNGAAPTCPNRQCSSRSP